MSKLNSTPNHQAVNWEKVKSDTVKLAENLCPDVREAHAPSPQPSPAPAGEGEECPVCSPILDAILLANSFTALAAVPVRISHARGITDGQRAALLQAVAEREVELLRRAGY